MQQGNRSNPIEDCRNHKIRSKPLVEIYSELGMDSKAARVAQCGIDVQVRWYQETDYREIHRANFCKVPLCVVCAWRRSKKIYGQLSQVMDAVGCGYKFIFLTLTIRNMPGCDLISALDEMLKAFHALCHRKEFKRIILGWFRTLEITHNWEADTYHPHLHVVLMVSENYAEMGSDYLPFQWWQDTWQDCLGIDYKPQVRIEAIKPSDVRNDYVSAINEVTKYVSKVTDYLAPKKVPKTKRHRLSVDAVRTLDKAIHHRRLVAFGGRFKELHKQLGLDDPISGNLADDQKLRTDLTYVIECYHWYSEESSYRKVKVLDKH